MEIGTGAGPAVIVAAGVVVLLTLLLAGPFLLLVTLVVLGVVAMLLVALLIATPYLLARSLHRRIAAWSQARHRALGSERHTDHPAIAQPAVPAFARPTTARGAH